MKKGLPFLNLIRWPNLVFIVLTQLLYYICIAMPLLPAVTSPLRFAALIIASVFIAAAGYIINDYFDLNIDQINKPDKIVLNKAINRRWAIFWHSGLSFSGLLLTAIAVTPRQWYLVLANAVVVVLLWLYSTSLKKKLLVGNILIALLTAWTVLIIYLQQIAHRPFILSPTGNESLFTKITLLYAGFAFVITLVREAVKDAEDMEGDRKYGCQTLPIKLGLNATRLYSCILLMALLVLLSMLSVYVLRFGWWGFVLYNIGFVLLPLIRIFKMAFYATTTAQYAQVSKGLKWAMLAGIASMFFFLYYF